MNKFANIFMKVESCSNLHKPLENHLSPRNKANTVRACFSTSMMKLGLDFTQSVAPLTTREYNS